MTNAVLYHLASGHAWFTCGALVLLVAALDAAGFFDTRDRLALGARLLLIAGLLLAVAGTTPAPLWLAIPLALAFLAYTFAGLGHPSPSRRLGLAGSAAGLVLLALVLELPYHWASPPAGRAERLYVLADSLGAGVGTERRTWPKLLREQAALDVRDLSAPGATTRSALRKLAATKELSADRGGWVLLCIGGNDLLGGTSADEFARNLDELLSLARGDPQAPRTVLMLELPLIPGAWAFGAHQRRLAARHGVVLIPRRLLAGVILSEENVTDGLHLSPAGHARMAERLGPWLGRP
jgi:lysophospholipase L1-like esterase